MGDEVNDPGLTSEQRAAIAVHNATQNRMCLNLSDNGQICVACAEVADQIDAAVEVERQRSQEAYEREKARAEKVEANLITVRDMLAQHVNEKLEAQAALAAARRTEAAAKDAHSYCLHMFSREWLADAKNRSIFAAQIFRTLDAALAAPAAGEEGKR